MKHIVKSRSLGRIVRFVLKLCPWDAAVACLTDCLSYRLLARLHDSVTKEMVTSLNKDLNGVLAMIEELSGMPECQVELVRLGGLPILCRILQTTGVDYTNHWSFYALQMYTSC